MPKAKIKTKTGTIVTIEGSSNEVAELIRLFENESPIKNKKLSVKNVIRSSHSSKASPVNLVSSLIDGGFFKKQKDLSEVKHALEELGHVYPVTSLSPTLLRLVRRKQLRRVKDKKRWLYVNS